MRIVMIFDQIQSGLGGKENSMLALGGKKMKIGSANMIDSYLREFDGEIVACLYCGDGFFKDNREEVSMKLMRMCLKLKAEVVICGPAFNYEGYGEMCGYLAKYIQENTSINTIAAMSKECKDTIESYKEKISIVKMPRKGGTGLTNSLSVLGELASLKYKSENTTDFESEYCY